MGIEKDIQQDKFRNIYQKASINLIYTVGWMRDKTKCFFEQEDITPLPQVHFSISRMYGCFIKIRFGEIMQDLLGIRKQMLAEVSLFPESDFNKTAVHPAYGKMNLGQWLNFFLLHEAHHMFTIFKLSAELKKGN